MVTCPSVAATRTADVRLLVGVEAQVQVTEGQVAAEPGHARVEYVVGLPGHGVVVVVDPGPQALLVELDAFVVGLTEEHGTEAAVADRQGLGLPVHGGPPKPEQMPAGRGGGGLIGGYCRDSTG